jgi:hypothetical protein
VETSEFGGGDGGEIISGEREVGGLPDRESVVAVVLIVGDWVIGTPFDDESRLLDKGLVLKLGKCLNASNCSVCHGENGPTMAGHAETRGEREEVIVAVSITCRGKGNGTQRARPNGVGRVVVVKELHVGAKFKAEVVVIRGGDIGHERKGTQRGRDAVRGGKHVEASYDVDNHMRNHDLGEARER